MNIERTIEFILSQQAKTEANLAQVSENQAKTDVRLAALSESQAKTDRQVKAIAALVQAGMKRVIRQENTFNTRLNALVAAQQHTDKKLARLIDVLSHQRTNGRR